MKGALILLAAGKSRRFGTDKLTTTLPDGREVWRASLDAFSELDFLAQRILVVSEDQLENSWPDHLTVVAGGQERTDSVRAGLQALNPEITHVLIHDAARPFVTRDVIQRVWESTTQNGSGCPVVPVTDTIRQREGEGSRTLPRADLGAVQTPQGARLDWIEQAYAQLTQPVTDDMGVLEAAGFPVHLTQGDPANRKITYADDMPGPGQPQSMNFEIRTGMGYDIHAFSTDPNRPMWLGGVEFDDRPGLEGHSDADALLHALVDALLGAAGMGDIGEHYPPSDEQWRNCPSLRFLVETAARVRAEGWNIQNVDVSVLAERPRLGPRRKEMTDVIASALGLRPDQVGIKATTNERLGAIGRGEGIAAFAIATLTRSIHRTNDHGTAIPKC